MHLARKIIWKIVDILYFIFGFQFVGYVEKTRISFGKKIYTTLLFIAFSYIAIIYVINITDSSDKSYFQFIFALVILEENSIVVISILTEIFITFPQNDPISRKIFVLDKLIGIDRNVKSKFLSEMTFCFTCYIIFVAIINIMGMVAWGFSLTIFISVWKMKAFDLMLLKFIMITHLHLCQLCLMNDHLRKRLNSKNCEKSNWLLAWNLYPKNIKICHHIDDLTLFMSIYTCLCENMEFFCKKFEIFVST